MLRSVPETTSDEIELYIRTYYSLLRSSEAVRVRSLEDSYLGTRASLHPNAEGTEPDLPAFTYAVSRLPSCMHKVRTVLLGQSDDVFVRRAGVDVTQWQRVYAVARRRKMYFDGRETLACYISSVSDIDDLIPMLTVFQIEWNKLHRRFHRTGAAETVLGSRSQGPLRDAVLEAIRQELELSEEAFTRLRGAWRHELDGFVFALADHVVDLRLRLLAGSVADYRQATQAWWESVTEAAGLGDLRDRDVYFVSSNPHALPNLVTSFPQNHQDDLLSALAQNDPEELLSEWHRIDSRHEIGLRNNFLYYVLRQWLDRTPEAREHHRQHELEVGIHRVDSPRYLDVGAQIIELGRLNPAQFDARLQMPGIERLKSSRAVVVNIDYPLGMAAYHILSQLTSSVPYVRGVYLMGKSATLNARVGDVLLPNVVFDEHSRNTYLFKNCFPAADVSAWLGYGTVFDNQKAVTVRGTLLQNRQFMTVFYKEGYTDIEMEAGPYLSAVYEDIYPQRHPIDEIVNLFINAPYDLGVLHYASDTPYSRRQTLLSKSLSYFGVDATYACGIAIMRRILNVELSRLAAGGA